MERQRRGNPDRSRLTDRSRGIDMVLAVLRQRSESRDRPVPRRPGGRAAALATSPGQRSGRPSRPQAPSRRRRRCPTPDPRRTCETSHRLLRLRRWGAGARRPRFGVRRGGRRHPDGKDSRCRSEILCSCRSSSAPTRTSALAAGADSDVGSASATDAEPITAATGRDRRPAPPRSRRSRRRRSRGRRRCGRPPSVDARVRLLARLDEARREAVQRGRRRERCAPAAQAPGAASDLRGECSRHRIPPRPRPAPASRGRSRSSPTPPSCLTRAGSCSPPTTAPGGCSATTRPSWPAGPCSSCCREPARSTRCCPRTTRRRGP